MSKITVLEKTFIPGALDMTKERLYPQTNNLGLQMKYFVLSFLLFGAQISILC